jgi:hypothetical protein
MVNILCSEENSTPGGAGAPSRPLEAFDKAIDDIKATEE